ncbi:MAG: metallophosphoesterase [Lachnospiraceae bacterium]|nr:metallophosphoesterase [Lachnospiraceae bacterium]
MRIIHCADLHLDSKMTANLPPEKARERRGELLAAFRRMTDFAVENQVTAMIIAGDLFDKKNCSVAAGNTVLGLIREHPELEFFYLKGNHDQSQIFSEQEKAIPNLHLFSPDGWTGYSLKNTDICISGTELTPENCSQRMEELQLDKGLYNIVVLHGQAEDTYSSQTRDSAGNSSVIPMKALRNQGIDYLALGHIHKQEAGRLDGRGIWCYPGALEGRGFDECGDHGCILLEVDPASRATEVRFVPLAGRRLQEITVDISRCSDSQEILREIRKRTEQENCSPRDLLKIILTGERELEHAVYPEYLERQLEDLFYYMKIEDRSRLQVDYRSFFNDPTLKGEFVRQVKQDSSLSEEDRSKVIQLGIRLLMGAEDFED